jgi:hypothetical protein
MQFEQINRNNRRSYYLIETDTIDLPGNITKL